MANPEHLELLKQGVGVWNEWRKSKDAVRLDLSGAIHEGRVLDDDVRLDLRYAQLEGRVLDGANFRLANLSGTNLIGASLKDANFNLAHLLNTKFNHSSLVNANFVAADLFGTSFRGSDLRGADFNAANLDGVNFQGAIFAGVSLRYAKLINVNIRDLNFGGVHVGETTFASMNLSLGKDLDKAIFHGPCTIGIDTLYQSAGKIPEAFLRGCGVPDELIIYTRSLVTRPIQFYSCFISYSSKDHPFAEHLHADLQSKGVRCWFAPEYLKIGDRFRDRIDESIRLHDKLLIVLSENSVASPWVSDEVESAIEREHREGCTVLFPIRIDDAVMESTQAWAASIRRTRHIGDFTSWENHDSYSKAFDRLLRDLKAEVKP
jgi:uncharacterized protein YjbI with pentapeptide repeats